MMNNKDWKNFSYHILTVVIAILLGMPVSFAISNYESRKVVAENNRFYQFEIYEALIDSYARDISRLSNCSFPGIDTKQISALKKVLFITNGDIYKSLSAVYGNERKRVYKDVKRICNRYGIVDVSVKEGVKDFPRDQKCLFGKALLGAIAPWEKEMDKIIQEISHTTFDGALDLHDNYEQKINNCEDISYDQNDLLGDYSP